MKRKDGTVLDDDFFPIVAWTGLRGEMLRPAAMAEFAQAGFTVLLCALDNRDPVETLDMARDAGVRLILSCRELKLGKNGKVTPESRRKVEKFAARVKDHPAFHTYYVKDEPWQNELENLGKLTRTMEEIDPFHPPLVNHFPPVELFGMKSIDHFYEKVFEHLSPKFLSYDLYPVCIASRAPMKQSGDAYFPEVPLWDRDQPWHFPEGNIYVKPYFYQALDLYRRMSLSGRIPFWAFAQGGRFGFYPKPTLGHLRFQLMSALAYGARGLSYYVYGLPLLRSDGTCSETMAVARDVNRTILDWAPLLRHLRSIGVYHTGPLWPMTQPPPMDMSNWEHPKPVFAAEGDPVLLGHFLGPKDQEYLMVVSKNPCSPSLIQLKLCEPKPIFELDSETRAFIRPYPPHPGVQPIALEPGQAKLLRLGGEGPQVL